MVGEWYESGSGVGGEWYESGARMVREWYGSGTGVVREWYERASGGVSDVSIYFGELGFWKQDSSTLSSAPTRDPEAEPPRKCVRRT